MLLVECKASLVRGAYFGDKIAIRCSGRGENCKKRRVAELVEWKPVGRIVFVNNEHFSLSLNRCATISFAPLFEVLRFRVC